jgi:hypothetical protein
MKVGNTQKPTDQPMAAKQHRTILAFQIIYYLALINFKINRIFFYQFSDDSLINKWCTVHFISSRY